MADHTDIDLDGIWPPDGAQALREALRLIESAAAIGRRGGGQEAVVTELNAAKGYLEEAITWVKS